MGGMRMTGLISGMDTESMVKELVKANSVKVDDAKKSKQKLEWKKEIWSGLNTKILNFFKGSLTKLKTNGSFKAKSATVNDTTKVDVKANGKATEGVHSVSVKQLASSAYLTGGNIKAGNNNYTSYVDSGMSTKFEDMTDANGNNLGISGQTISINNGEKTVEFTLGGSEANSVASIEELNKKLSETEGFSGLSASLKDGAISFSNTSLKSETITNDTGEEVKVETGTDFTIESSALGISGTAYYKKVDAKEATEDTPAVDGKSTSLAGTVLLKQEHNFTSADISGSTKLKDIGIKVGTTFSIKGHDYVVDENSTLDDLANRFSKMGISANFDEGQGRFYLNANGTGAENDFNITSSDSDALDILGLGSSAKKIDAKDAIIDYNGVEYKNASNTFELNGLSITAKAVTDSDVNITVDTDTESMYNTIKDFVKEYNSLIDELNNLYNEENEGYDPLTDDERASLSDKQIEQWEEKAKKGLLRRDSTLNSLTSQMRTILNSGISVTNADGTTSTVTLSSLGIVTSSDYTEKGKLHILGDPDDPTYANETNILKQKLSETPEVFSQVFAGTSEKEGVGLKIYNYLSKSMKYQAGISSSMTIYNNLSMDKDIDKKDDKIDEMNEKLAKLEDKYYKQFAAMETAMAKMQQQQNALASMLGLG